VPEVRSIIMVILGLSAGCIPEYRAPTFDQPHATLKLSRAYARSMGRFLSESLVVDGGRAYAVTVPSSVAAAPRTDTLLVHPGAARVVVTSVFFHEESQAEDETKWVDVPYEDVEIYDCGTFDNPQSCTRMVTKSRSELRHETVYGTVQVPDAACHREITFAPAANDVYLVKFEFVESGTCRLSCFQRLKQADGTLALRPCPPANGVVKGPSNSASP
jgi:hypothetical protein